ncbi:MAG TPA: hypothetical protein VFW11_19905 [Cyclobacteriaceae bacterium]|nr:hypothetical protein [Cyclobacteriaceae bacterium]
MLVLDAIGLYLIGGVLFAIPFLFRWIVFVDESAGGTSWLFRLLLLPGCIVLWPVLLRKYIKARKEI